MLANWLGTIQPGMFLLAFAGGLLGASLGPLLAFSFTGIMVLLGELLLLSGGEINLTNFVAFGTILGPHVCFGGGAAALAYAHTRSDFSILSDESSFPYHPAKQVAVGLGSQRDILVVGGIFGMIGYGITQTLSYFAVPTDPVAGGVVLSAFAHRIVFGFSIFGLPGSDNPKETWLPYQHRWQDVTLLSVGLGMIGGFLTYRTGSAFIGFGLSTAFLVFLCADVQRVPVTHHITLPAGTAVLCYLGVDSLQLTPTQMQSEITLPVVLLLGGFFGLVGGLAGEICQRLFYEHAETHLDPPAAGIVVSITILALLAMAGVFPSASWIPTPFTP